MAEEVSLEVVMQTTHRAILIAIESAACRVVQCEQNEPEKGERWAETARSLAMAYINLTGDPD